MFLKSRLVNTSVAMALMLGTGLGLSSHSVFADQLKQEGAQKFNVQIGAQIFTDEGGKPSWQGMKFYPGTITVNVGDTVTWKANAGAEPHTVTFMGNEKNFPELFTPEGGAAPGAGGPPAAGGPPPSLVVNPKVAFAQGGNTYDGTAYVNSGMLASDIPGPKEYTLTFTKPGTYEYFCALHSGPGPDGKIQGMTAKVVVQDAGSALPKTPAQVDAEATQMIAADTDAAKAKEAELLKQAPAPTKNSDGTTTYHVNMGAEMMEQGLEYQRFWPKVVNVKQGDTVEWSMPMGGFHTATFGDEPDLIQVEPGAGGQPVAKVNPEFFPAGDHMHMGTGYYNSGPLAGPDDPADAGPKAYSLTFTKAGRFEYICIPHYHNGMDGTVVVEARTEAPTGATTGSTTNTTTGATDAGMPRTGNANSTNWTIPAIFVLVASAIALAGTMLRRGKASKQL